MSNDQPGQPSEDPRSQFDGGSQEHADDQLGSLIRRAYSTSVDVDTAARHLWVLHRGSAENPPVRKPRVRHSLVAGLVAMMVLSTSGIAVAMSGGALPGETLYPVKRGTERVHLLVSRGAESDARLHLKFARARLSEAVAVAPTRPAELPRLLDDAAASVERAEQVGGMSVEVVAVRAEASETITTLTPTVEAEVAVALAEIAQRLGGVAVALDLDTTDDVEAPGDGQDAVREAPERIPESSEATRLPEILPDPWVARDSETRASDQSGDAEASEPEPSSDEQEVATVETEPQHVAPEEPEHRADTGGERGADDAHEDDGKRMPGVRELGGMLSDRSPPQGRGGGESGEPQDGEAHSDGEPQTSPDEESSEEA